MQSTSQDTESLRKVFDSFDKDSDGFIDISEIRLAAKDLNLEVNEHEIKALFIEIDKNHDGRITFEEFTTWHSLNKGTQSKLLGLYKLKALNLAKKAKSGLAKLPATYESGFQTHQYTVRFGEGDIATKLEVKLHYGLASREHFEHLSKGLGYDDSVNAIVIKLHSDNAENAKFGLKELIENSLELASALIPGADQIISLLKFSYHTEGDVIQVGITGNHPMVEDTIQSVSQIISNFVTDDFTATADLQFGLKHDLKTIFTKSKYDEASLLTLILEGLLVHFHLKCNSQVPKQLTQLYLAQFAEYHLVPKQVKQVILLALLTNSKFDLNFNPADKETLDRVLTNLGLGEVSGFKLFDTLKQIRDTGVGDMLEALPAAKQAVEFAKENLKANFTIGVRGPKSLLTAHFKTDGVKEIVHYILTL